MQCRYTLPYPSRTHPESGDGVVDCPMPGVFDSEEVLPGLHAEVLALLQGRLDEEAVLPLVHVLALLDDAEHGLVDCPHGGVLHPVLGAQLGGKDLSVKLKVQKSSEFFTSFQNVCQKRADKFDCSMQ